MIPIRKMDQGVNPVLKTSSSTEKSSESLSSSKKKLTEIFHRSQKKREERKERREERKEVINRLKEDIPAWKKQDHVENRPPAIKPPIDKKIVFMAGVDEPLNHSEKKGSVHDGDPFQKKLLEQVKLQEMSLNDVNENPKDKIQEEELQNKKAEETKKQESQLLKTAPEDILLIFDEYVLKHAERVKAELLENLNDFNGKIKIVAQPKFNPKLVPETKFLVFNIQSNPRQKDLSKLNAEQLNLSETCKSNCVFVALDRSSERLLPYYEQNVKNSGMMKDGVFKKRYITQPCSKDVGVPLITDQSLPVLIKQISGIYLEFVNLKNK